MNTIVVKKQEEIELVDDYRIGYDRCPSCLTFIEKSWKYCGKCGYKIKGFY